MRIVWIFTVIQVVFLAGCIGSDNSQSAEEFIMQVKQEKIKKIEELPKVQEYKSVTYTVSAKRDPFQPLPEFLANHDKDKKVTNVSILQKPRPDANRKKELLENYSLDSIDMVGIIKKGANFWAIVKDKTNMIHRVHVGNYLGENSGRIEKITDKTIVVQETITDGQGGWITRMTSLNLVK